MSFLSSLSGLARNISPLAQAGALFATGGTAATLGKVALAGNILGAASQPRGTQQGQAVAVSQQPRPAQETSTSGQTDVQNLYRQPAGGGITNISFQPAGGMIAPPLPPRAPMMSPTPAFIQGLVPFAAGAAGIAAPFIIDAITGQEKKLVVTRKLKSQVKRAVDLIGIEATADGMGVDTSIVTYILLKKLRNDGAYVTKAAMRKTSSTLRKMKRMCDMYDDLRPAAKRRAPTRRSSQTITNVR